MIHENFTTVWLEAWNSHNLDAIMAHYADDVSFYSPVAAELSPEGKGHISGKEALREYFSMALQKYPGLCFTLHKALKGVDSVVLYYTSIRHLKSAECMIFDREGKVREVYAHYAP
ncbi:SnoaL-like domain-containing protein [Sinomicrobium oceani]|uniref:SnoaL-like domain-containing protein n=1 Tax=Sinomicrobium oceani TaxID=1150368 RepID=A0A1K1QD73_9FLAO|nr:nuclear transport factor 2 family protein [Sinomicrobium oceani]SFW57649.1 SnoaL-like domain-containing protein [Sinomicrobium oceani]